MPSQHCTIHEVQSYIKFRGQSRVRTYVLVREQIYSLSPLTTRPSALLEVFDIKKLSRRWDSNPRPTDYKSVALPTELLRHYTSIKKEQPLLRDGKGNGKLYSAKFWTINFLRVFNCFLRRCGQCAQMGPKSLHKMTKKAQKRPPVREAGTSISNSFYDHPQIFRRYPADIPQIFRKSYAARFCLRFLI